MALQYLLVRDRAHKFFGFGGLVHHHHFLDALKYSRALDVVEIPR